MIESRVNLNKPIENLGDLATRLNSQQILTRRTSSGKYAGPIASWSWDPGRVEVTHFIGNVAVLIPSLKINPVFELGGRLTIVRHDENYCFALKYRGNRLTLPGQVAWEVRGDHVSGISPVGGLQMEAQLHPGSASDSWDKSYPYSCTGRS